MRPDYIADFDRREAASAALVASYRAHAARLRDPAVQARIADADRLLRDRLLRDRHAEHAALAPPPAASAEALLAEMARVIAAA